MKIPPDNLPSYRVLTGPDDAAFCHRVSEALLLGYELYGPPAVSVARDKVLPFRFKQGWSRLAERDLVRYSQFTKNECIHGAG
jgi:hypothetical protein